MSDLQEIDPTTDLTDMTAEQTEARILSIIDLVNNKNGAQSRSNTTYTDEETVWNIEAALNYQYVDFSKAYSEHDVFVDTIPHMRAASNTVTETEFQVLYDNVLNSVSDQYYSLNGTDNEVAVFDISYVSSSDNELVITVTMVTGLDDLEQVLWEDSDIFTAQIQDNLPPWIQPCTNKRAEVHMTNRLNETYKNNITKFHHFTDILTIFNSNELHSGWLDDLMHSGQELLSHLPDPPIDADVFYFSCCNEPPNDPTHCGDPFCDELNLSDEYCVTGVEMNVYYNSIVDFSYQFIPPGTYTPINIDVVRWSPCLCNFYDGVKWASYLSLGKQIFAVSRPAVKKLPEDSPLNPK